MKMVIRVPSEVIASSVSSTTQAPIGAGVQSQPTTLPNKTYKSLQGLMRCVNKYDANKYQFTMHMPLAVASMKQY
jgi:hypothetical protein